MGGGRGESVVVSGYKMLLRDDSPLKPMIYSYQMVEDCFFLNCVSILSSYG